MAVGCPLSYGVPWYLGRRPLTTQPPVFCSALDAVVNTALGKGWGRVEIMRLGTEDVLEEIEP